MAITLSTPRPSEVSAVVEGLKPWQVDGAPVQLHPGDVAWNLRLGAEATASTLRTWHRDEHLVAVGFLDGSQLVRFGLDPALVDDIGLAEAISADLRAPDRGVLAAGAASVEIVAGTALAEQLLAAGWRPGDEWASLRMDLTDPVPDPGVRIEVVGHEVAAERVAVHRASFDVSRFTVEQWRALATSASYADARCLLALDTGGVPVAATSVWSAGRGRPGLIEPLGAHRDHRGHGYGRAIIRAAAVHLREMGASSVLVKTEGHNAVGIAAYRSAGMVQDPVSPDLARD